MARAINRGGGRKKNFPNAGDTTRVRLPLKYHDRILQLIEQWEEEATNGGGEK